MEALLMLAPSEIRPNPRQPRQVFDPVALETLTRSVAQHGVLQPLAVRKTEDGWELIAGERRLRAAQAAGLERVPCVELNVGADDSALLALVENLHRRDLNCFEEADAIAAYVRSAQITQEEAARRLGRSASAVANKLRLLRLSPACRARVLECGLTERHARALLALEDEAAQLEALERICAQELNVAQTEQYIARCLTRRQSTPPRRQRTFILKDVRLFLGSLDRELRLIREAGVDAQTERQDTEDEILLTIRIPKGLPKRVVTGL